MMTQTWIIARRELRSFFDHPTAYVLQVAFLTLALFLAFRTIYANAIGTLRPFFDLLPWLLAIFVPAVTMKSLAEERQTRTLEWLRAQPLDEAALVLGKFLGNWLFVLCTLAFSFPLAVGVLVVSGADPGIIVAQYVGASLLAALFVALGIWASSVTRNQITSFILATTGSLLLVLIGAPVVRMGLPPRLSAILGEVAVVRHFEGLARGVIDLRDVLYFVAATAFFLVLAGFFLTRDRLSTERLAYRRLRLGTATAALLALVATLLGSSLPGRIDLTRDNLFTLSQGTRSIVSGLDDLVNVKLFVSRDLPLEVQSSVRDVRDVLADLEGAADGAVQVSELYPDRDDRADEEARALGIGPIEFNVLRDDEFQVRRGWFGLAIQYADAQETIPVISRTEDLELRLATAISTLTRDRTPLIGWGSGAGLRGQFEFQLVRQALAERFEFEGVPLDADSMGLVPAIPEVDLLVVATPNAPLSELAVSRIEDHLSSGRPALLMLKRHQLNPQAPTTVPMDTGLEDLLAEAGVTLEPAIAYDLRSSQRIQTGQQGMFSLVQNYPYWPIALPATDHPTVRDLNAMTLGWPTPLSLDSTSAAVPLWMTTASGGSVPAGTSIAPDSPLRPDPQSLRPQVLAAAIPDDAASGRGRLVVVGDASFLEDQFLRADPQNLAFFANALDWLAQDENLIDIRSKNRMPPPLVFASDSGQALLKWGCLIGIPLVLILVGVLRVGGRVQRAKRLWEVAA